MDQSPPSVPVPGQLAQCMKTRSEGGSFSTIALSARNSLSSRSSTLFTNFNASPIDNPISHWWEPQAGDILRGYDLQAIQLLCRYRTYRDSSSILKTRWNPLIKSFLLKLSAGMFSRKYIDDLDKEQIVKELLARLEPSPPDRLCWHSTLPAALLHPDAWKVASELHEESLSLFERITFQDYLRKALYPDEDVQPLEVFRNWHNGLVDKVRDRLTNFRGETEKFVHVMERLPEGSPVYWAVEQSVLFTLHGSGVELAPYFGLEIIYDPLRDLFSHSDANLKGILKHLPVLEERFQQRYRQMEVDWIHKFDTDTTFFDDITTMSPQDLAKSLTQSDFDAFSLLEPHDFIDGGDYLQFLNRQWDTRCRAVQECFIVDSRLSDLLADLAQELLKNQDFYSLFAVLLALRGSGFDECRLPSLFALINTEHNYASYRKAYREARGLPFLPPHIRQLKSVQLQVVSALLPSKRDKHFINSTCPQSLEQPEVSLEH